MAIGAYRVYSYRKPASETSVEKLVPQSAPTQESATDLPLVSDAAYYVKLYLVSLLAAACVKSGSLYLDFPFEGSSEVAATVVALPVLLNMMKWGLKSYRLMNSQRADGFERNLF